jgi:hypothetical protein
LGSSADESLPHTGGRPEKDSTGLSREGGVSRGLSREGGVSREGDEEDVIIEWITLDRRTQLIVRIREACRDELRAPSLSGASEALTV